MPRKPLLVSRGVGGVVPLGVHLCISQRTAAGSEGSLVNRFISERGLGE